MIESEREDRITFLNEQEDWLYEDGANANYTVLEEKFEELKKDFEKISNRKRLHEGFDDAVVGAQK